MRRLAFGFALFALAATFGGAGTVSASTPPRTLAAAPINRAALVVQYGDLQVHRQCVSFAENDVTGYELLRRAGLSLTVSQSSQGTAVCRIGRDGCSDANNCFCKYPQFWGYYTGSDSGQWTFSQQGAHATKVRNGGVQGWVWGKDGKPAPPGTKFGAVCPPEATPAPAPVVTVAPTPVATTTKSRIVQATPKPSEVPLEVLTPTPAVTQDPMTPRPQEVALESKEPPGGAGYIVAALLGGLLAASALGLAIVRRRRH